MADDYDHLLGLITAHDLILRILFAQWAKGQSDPRGAARETLDTTLAQLRASRGDAPRDESKAFEVASEALKEFREHVDLRLQVSQP